MTTPSFIGSQATTFTSTFDGSKVTASLTCNSGDILVAHAVTQDAVFTLGISSSPSLTWTLEKSNEAANFCSTYTWTAVATGNTTVTFTRTDALGGDAYYGGYVENWRGSSGVGASVKDNNASGAPTVDLTSTQADSAISSIVGDWNAVGGTLTPRTNAGAFTQLVNTTQGTNYSVYGGYHANAGAVGTDAIGYTAPTGQAYTIIAVEIKGTSSAQTITQSSRFDNTNSFFAGGVSKQSAKSVTQSARFDNTNTFFAGTVTKQSAQSVAQAARFDNANTFFGGTVSNGASSQTITQSARFDNSNSFFSGTVTKQSALSVTQSARFNNANTFFAGTVNLMENIDVTWTASPDTSVTGYYVYWDTTSHAAGVYSDYANSADVSGRLTEAYTIHGLTPGTTYYINISSHGTGGHDEFESELFGEISQQAGATQITQSSRFDNSNSFFAGSVTKQSALSISQLARFDNANQFFTGTISKQLDQTVTQSARFNNANTFFGGIVGDIPINLSKSLMLMGVG